jgi:hypothetical protein
LTVLDAAVAGDDQPSLAAVSGIQISSGVARLVMEHGGRSQRCTTPPESPG